MTKYTKHDPGTFCWIELHTSDGEAAKRFYCDLFGWTAKVSPEYVEIHVGDQAVGGLMTMQPQVPAQVPAHWLAYFWVDDVDAAAQKANAGGARTLVPPMDIPKVGRFAVLSDPQGAVFALFKGSM